jgi:ERF superfamily
MTYDNNILGPSSSPETSELTKALAKAQSQYQIVAYDSANPHFKSKFASYAQCCDSLRGPLTANGLSLPDFRPGLVNGQWIVVGTLRHSSGQWISGVAPLLMGKSDMQSFGAAMTYAKRTLLMALCGGFSGESDDDGQSVSQHPQQAKAEAVSKHLVYQQGAINAINAADSKAAAKKHLDMVELRVREKAVPKEVFLRCEAEFKKVWDKKEVKA